MEIEHQAHKRCDVFRVKGRVDGSNAPRLQEALLTKINEGRPNIVVTLRDVEFLSSAALRALIAGFQEAQKRPLRSGRLVIAEAPPDIRDVFRLAAMNSLFDFYDSETDAVGSF